MLRVCYESGPCGFVIYRYLVKTRIDCIVISPSSMRPNDRAKTDRRDALTPARLLRTGDLAADAQASTRGQFVDAGKVSIRNVSEGHPHHDHGRDQSKVVPIEQALDIGAAVAGLALHNAPRAAVAAWGYLL